ncbi:MAG: hypothetical protein JWR65_1047 [Massilia sp.]|nr:hypothetical protein [Massilia sp.]
MQRTLIAVFDNHADAQSAIEELVSSGFSRPQIRLSEGDPTGGSSAIGGDEAPDTPRSSGSFADGIKNFLGTIFGTDNSEHVQTYTDAVTRGHHVLTLTATDESEADRASAIIARFGPVDIDERAALWSGGAAAGGAATGGAMPGGARQPQASASMSQQSVQGRPVTMQGGQGGASQQRGSGVKVFQHEAATMLNETEAAIRADELDTGAAGGGRGSGPAGSASSAGQGAVQGGQHQPATMLNETEAAIETDELDTGAAGGGRGPGPAVSAGAAGAAGQAGVQGGQHQAATMLNETEAAIDADDQYYLGHFNSNYAGSGDQYGNHAPAYKYGADMATNEQYRGRPWTDVNSELRRDWEGRNPGAAWDRFEASVRYGWERRGS